MKYLHLLNGSVLLTISLVVLGCGSGGPKELDAAAEQEMRSEMAKVEAAEQEHFRKSPPPATAPQKTPEQNPRVEGSNQGEPSF